MFAGHKFYNNCLIEGQCAARIFFHNGIDSEIVELYSTGQEHTHKAHNNKAWQGLGTSDKAKKFHPFLICLTMNYEQNWERLCLLFQSVQTPQEFFSRWVMCL